MTKFLVIRRDNIGDLLCTTPLIRSLRLNFPDAEIDVLVNSYNEGVVKNNPDISRIFIYQKGKHAEGILGKLKAYKNKIKLIFELRSKSYDWGFVASPGKRTLSLAKQVGIKSISGFYRNENEKQFLKYGVDLSVCDELHEVERVHKLINPVIKVKDIPAMVLVPDLREEKNIKNQLKQADVFQKNEWIGLHISARKPSNRWTEEKYIGLVEHLIKDKYIKVMLFWSPGSENCLTHPGDDELADRIVNKVNSPRLLPMKTENIQHLIAAVNQCTLFICSDGGAMHIAAALGKKIICFFGDSNEKQWYPWNTEYYLLKNQQKKVSEIDLDIVLSRLNGQ